MLAMIKTNVRCMWYHRCKSEQNLQVERALLMHCMHLQSCRRLGHQHLLCELRHTECTVLLAATGCEGREADHEEVQAREGDQVHCQLAQICIQLACAAPISRFRSSGQSAVP